jgi:UDP-N-acetylglucosamine acyltransferase
MSLIHPTAQIDPKAELDSSVKVGAYSVIGAGVKIAAGCSIGPHVVIEGPSTLGLGNSIFQFASIGAAPQDKKYAGEPTELIIGNNNTIREFVTLNRGTVQDQGVTRIGDRNWIMAYVHVAHDCVVGSDNIFANTVNLAGHVQVGDWVILGGYTGVHQFCKIGSHAMTAVGSVVLHDLPPFVMASGEAASAHGINAEGLKRRGFSTEQIAEIKKVYRVLYRSELSLEQARAALRTEYAALAGAPMMLAFLDQVTRGIVR